MQHDSYAHDSLIISSGFAHHQVERKELVELYLAEKQQRDQRKEQQQRQTQQQRQQQWQRTQENNNNLGSSAYQTYCVIIFVGLFYFFQRFGIIGGGHGPQSMGDGGGADEVSAYFQLHRLTCCVR